MIVHTYYTAGMHNLAKVFVKSFNHYHKGIMMYIDAVGIDTNMQLELQDLYPCAIINRRPYLLEYWSRQCHVSLKTLNQWKDEVEHGYVTENNRAWKLLIAGDHRVRCLREMLKLATVDYSSLLVHFDIDTLFRSNICCIEDEMKFYDAGLKLRPTIMPIKARITIDMMVFRKTYASTTFLDTWISCIDMVKPVKRPIGYGQISCWDAYKIVPQETFSVLKLPLKYGLPGRNRSTDAIWCGNVHKLRKDDCSTLFQQELNRLKGI